MQVANSPADGYTLLIGSNGPLTVNPFVQAKLGYDPLKDFVAVGLANLAPHAIVLNNSVRGEERGRTGRDVEEAADHARHVRRRQRLASDLGALQRRDRRQDHPRALSRRRRAHSGYARGHDLRRDDGDVDDAAAARQGQGPHPRRGVEQAIDAGAGRADLHRVGRQGFHGGKLRRPGGAGEDTARDRGDAGEGADQGAGRQEDPGHASSSPAPNWCRRICRPRRASPTTSRRTTRTPRRPRRSPGSSPSKICSLLFEARRRRGPCSTWRTPRP